MLGRGPVSGPSDDKKRQNVSSLLTLILNELCALRRRH